VISLRGFRSVAVTLQISCSLLFIPLSDSYADSSCGAIADRITHGGIVWTENAIFVQGTAAPNLSDPYKSVATIKRETQRAATLDAYRKAAEVLDGVNITGDRMASDSPQVTTRIQAYVSQPQICKAKYYADGGVDMVVKVPLSGDLAQALLPEAGFNVATAGSAYSGLIVDAANLTFSPALSPRFITPHGQVLFSQEKVRVEVIRSGSTVRYVNSEKQITREMVGTRPLKISAIALGPQSPSDLILADSASEALKDSPYFLGDGKVVIITAAPQTWSCSERFPEVKDQLIDWERKMVLARGFGRMNFTGQQDEAVRIRMMERAAEVDAQRRLLELLLDIPVDGRSRLRDTPVKSNRIQGIVRNAVRCGARYYRDGRAEVVLAAPFEGIVTEAIKPEGTPGTPVQTLAAAAATGLIVDTTGSNYYPVLAPELVTPDGTIVYNSQNAAKGWAHKHGIAGFQGSMDAARADPRIGPRPVIVRAGPDSRLPQRLVLSAVDAGKLAEIRQMPVALSQCRVVIVTEQPKLQ